MMNRPIYRLTTAVSDIDQTNINRDIRDGNWLSTFQVMYLPLCLRICFSSGGWKYKSHVKGIFSRSIELRLALQPTVFLWSLSTIFAFLSSTLFASG